MEVLNNAKSDRRDRMPLLNMNRRSNGQFDGQAEEDSDGENHDWSDQELEEFVHDPLEGVLRSVLQRPREISRKQCVISAVFVSSVSLLTGFLLAYVLFFYVYPPLCNVNVHNSSHNRDPVIVSKKLIQEINGQYIRNYLRGFDDTSRVSGGSDQNLRLAEVIRDIWLANGLSSVLLVPYNVLLSRTDPSNSSLVQVVNQDSGDVVVNLVDSALKSSCHAYSSSGRVIGHLVYVNYGRLEDYKYVSDSGIDLLEKIVIARYGKNSLSDKVKLAEMHKASGLILYPDPGDYATAEESLKGHPNSFWFPETGTPSEFVLSYCAGDPQTPLYPSVESAYRLSEAEVATLLPKLLVHPISSNDARQLLSLMDGPPAPKGWTGTFNVSYNLGPGFKNNSLKAVLDVRTKNSHETIYNVIGIIPGEEEYDRYVMLGNHRNALNLDGVGSNSGSAVLTELTRVFGHLMKTGWKPRRTIVFFSWDAGEFGFIGSTEWVENYIKRLGERGVVYINVDLAVAGNASLIATATPSAYDVIYSSAKKIPNPNPAEVAAGRATLLDTWLHVSSETGNPLILPYGLRRDPFLYFAGIPAVDFAYQPNKALNPDANPLYRSVDVVDSLIDPELKYHVAVVQLWGEMIRAFSGNPLIPLTLPNYADQIESAFNAFSKSYYPLLQEKQISLSYLNSSVRNLSFAAYAFNASLAKRNLNNPVSLRIINDQIMQVERALLQPEGHPNHPMFRHVFQSPSMVESTYFSELVDILNTISENYYYTSSERDQMLESLKKRLAAVTFYIQSTADILEDPVKF